MSEILTCFVLLLWGMAFIGAGLSHNLVLLVLAWGVSLITISAQVFAWLIEQREEKTDG